MQINEKKKNEKKLNKKIKTKNQIKCKIIQAKKYDYVEKT